MKFKFKLPRIKIIKDENFVDPTPHFTMEEKFPQVITKVQELVEIEKKDKSI